MRSDRSQSARDLGQSVMLGGDLRMLEDQEIMEDLINVTTGPDTLLSRQLRFIHKVPPLFSRNQSNLEYIRIKNYFTNIVEDADLLLLHYNTTF